MEFDMILMFGEFLHLKTGCNGDFRQTAGFLQKGGLQLGTMKNLVRSAITLLGIRLPSGTRFSISPDLDHHEMRICVGRGPFALQQIAKLPTVLATHAIHAVKGAPGPEYRPRQFATKSYQSGHRGYQCIRDLCHDHASSAKSNRASFARCLCQPANERLPDALLFSYGQYLWSLVLARPLLVCRCNSPGRFCRRQVLCHGHKALSNRGR